MNAGNGIALGIAALALASAPCVLHGETPAAVTPYTFIGRVMDARHRGFDTNRIARLSARDSSGRLLAESKTFFASGSRNNYVLDIPMATGAAKGFAVQSDGLEITAVDESGKTWSGVVVDASAGAPAGVREVDIVLGEDLDGDGIDDALYRQLKAQWEASEYWRRGETFDPERDYDGDGVSTIREGLVGTDPFNPDDSLRITAFAKRDASGGGRTKAGTPEGGAEEPYALSFNALGGRAYTVEESTDPDAQVWARREFELESGEAANVVAMPSDARRTPCTVYLLPSSPARALFRIRAE